MCLGKPFQPERKLACDIQNKAKAPAMISKLDRSCNWDNKNRPAIATRINSLSSLLLENIGSPTKQWFADNLRHLPLPPVTPSTKVESSAYPGHGQTMTEYFGSMFHLVLGFVIVGVLLASEDVYLRWDETSVQFSKAKIRFQLFFMLMTNQPSFFASS